MKKYIGTFLILCAVCMGAAQAKAVTLEDLLSEISSLKQQVIELRSQVSAQVISSRRENIVSPDVSEQVIVSPPTPSIDPTRDVPVKALITKTLSKGVTDAEVKVLQSVLKETGYLKAEVTGYYGRATEAAVKEYQVAKGLEATGTVGPKTRATLTVTATAYIPTTPSSVTTVTTITTPTRPAITVSSTMPTSTVSINAGCVAGARFSVLTGKPCVETKISTTSTIPVVPVVSTSSVITPTLPAISVVPTSPAIVTSATTQSKSGSVCLTGGYSYAGKWGTFGSGNGQFDMPYEIDVDASGNVYVPDTHNNTVQKFDSNGNFILKFGGTGSGNGQIDRSYGLGVDALGNVYVADTFNNRIQKFSGTGTYISQFGSGILNHPGAVKFDQAGNIYVVDIDNRRVAKFDSNGNLLLTFGSVGTGNGQFTDLRGIAIAPNGNVYVIDNGGANRVQIFNSNGTYIGQFGTQGTGNGQFKNPADLHFDSNGYLYVVEAHGNRIQKFDASGNYMGQFGSYGSGDGQISYPLGMTIDASNNVYVSDWENKRIVKFSPCVQ